MSIDQIIGLVFVCICLVMASIALIEAMKIGWEQKSKRNRRLELYEKIIGWQVRRWHLAQWDKCTLREWLGLSPEEYQEFLTGNRSDSVPRTDAQ